MKNRDALLWGIIACAFLLAGAMVWAKLTFDLGAFLGAVVALFHGEHIGSYIDAKFSKEDGQ